MTRFALKTNVKNTIVMFIASFLFIGLLTNNVFADENKSYVEGKLIVVEGDKTNYSLENQSIELGDIKPNGKLQISGNIKTISHKDNFISYIVSGDNVSIAYIYNDSLTKAEKSDWHIYDDSKKEVSGIQLEDRIRNGALIIQTSIDGHNWVDGIKETNVFEEKPKNSEPQYTCSKIELDNGRYYRVLVAYGTEIVTETDGFFIKHKKLYRRTLECYEFYIADEKTIQEATNNSKYQLTNVDTKVNTGSNNNGYNIEEAKPIKDDDPHFGWELGSFYIAGFSGKVNENSNEPVFLKNVGDEITLKFSLKEDINKLNGNDCLYINSDKEGYDEKFEVPKQKNGFGKGTLVVRYKDYYGVTHDPVIYTNFLEANASLGADTTISLFEEGMYEIALDYEIKFDKTKVPFVGWSLVHEINHYKVYFKFIIGNANCMVYPFDVVTGSELTNNSVTKNGFTLDLARSHSLDIKIEKQVIKETEDEIIPDTRFNTQVQEGEKYTDDGIYIITVKNKYTNTETTKTIYVGDNPYITMYMYEGKSLEEIKEALKNKDTEVKDDGTIVVYENENDVPVIIQEESKDNSYVYGIVGFAVAGIIAVALFMLRNKKNPIRKEIESKANTSEINNMEYKEIDCDDSQNNNEENNDEKDN
ncbi:MAG: hypothetical protein KBT35_00470 [Firmicutes bacterium]|nr:hypothetical protein [Candidatus Colivicinus equi]